MSSLERESVLRCPECQGAPYHIYRRRNHAPDGAPLQTFQTVLWPASADIAPPADPRRIMCPTCHVELRRVAP